MFASIIQKLFLYFDLPQVPNFALQEIPEEKDCWLYILTCNRNYSNRNVFKIGYSSNVEQHICNHVSWDASIDELRSFKIKMSLDEAKAIKRKIKLEVRDYSLVTRRKFAGRADWFHRGALSLVMGMLNDVEIETGFLHTDINMLKFLKEYEVLARIKRDLPRNKRIRYPNL